MKKITDSGKVVLVGAGPGDPELLTLKAVKYIQRAEVILTDRLVSQDILVEHANDDAEIVYVGKQSRKGDSTAQATINNLLVHYALLGKQVVRLKGGDVSIFSNIFDELQTLVRHHIPYEIVPGITAASGAAAYCGIPLTARNFSNAVRFLTNYQPGTISTEYWSELALTSDTIVFYMSAETILDVVEKLTFYGISKDKLLAVVEQATTPVQQVHVYDLYEFAKATDGKKYMSPSLVIIGRVVNLHEQFNWLKNEKDPVEYFKKPEAKVPLQGKFKRA